MTRKKIIRNDEEAEGCTNLKKRGRDGIQCAIKPMVGLVRSDATRVEGAQKRFED